MLTRFRVYVLKSPSLQDILNNPKSIVLTRLEDVGDMLMFVPTLRAFKQGYPRARLYLVTRSETGTETIDGCPYVDEIIRLENTLNGKLRLIKKLRRVKPDIFVISTQCWGRVKWGFWGGARVIIGHQRSPLYNRERKVKLAGFIMRSPHYDEQANEAENNLKLAQAAGIVDANPALEYSWIGSDSRKYINMLFEEMGLGVDDFVVGIAPGTKRGAKAWYADSFAEVADELVERHAAKVLLIGTEAEKDIARQIKQKMRFEAMSVVGKTSLKQLPALIERINLLIGVDSGPIHFAAALGTPYVALFGPGEFAKWKHDWNPSMQKNICKHAPCAPCNKEFCEEHICMKQIKVEDVLAQVGEMDKDGVI
jgi:ADP-heptose:LPS heptosyltransferase